MLNFWFWHLGRLWQDWNEQWLTGKQGTSAMVMMLSAACWLKDVCAAARCIYSHSIYICTQQESCRAVVEGMSLWERHNPGLFLEERSRVWCDTPDDSPCSVSANIVASLPAPCSCCTDQGCLEHPAWLRSTCNSSITAFIKPCSWNQAARCGQGQAAAQTQMCRFPVLLPLTKASPSALFHYCCTAISTPKHKRKRVSVYLSLNI